MGTFFQDLQCLSRLSLQGQGDLTAEGGEGHRQQMQNWFHKTPLLDIGRELTVGNARQAKLVSAHGIGR